LIKIYQSAVTAATNVYFALSVDDYQINKAQITQIRGDSLNGIVSLSLCFYVATSNFTTSSSFLLGTIDESLLFPNHNTMFSGVEILPASYFHNGAGTVFAGTQVLDKISLTVGTSGGIYAWCNTITTPSTLSGTDYIIIPITISFSKIEDVVAI
jgi:hypothetical protein